MQEIGVTDGRLAMGKRENGKESEREGEIEKEGKNVKEN